MIAIVSSFISTILNIGADANDTEEVRLKKAILVSGCLMFAGAASLWAIIYLYYGENMAALISVGYSLVSLCSLAYFKVTGRYRLFLFTQFLLGLLIPFIHTVVLGGFWESGMVVIWALISPLGTLVFYETRQARWWWTAYLVLLALATYFQPLFQHENAFPQSVIRAYFFLNIGSVFAGLLVLLSYFIRQKNEAYRLLHIEEQKAENLLLNILPKEIAAILKNEERTIADSFDGASILFADLVGFTHLTAHMAPVEMVNLLNEVFSHFDMLVEKYDVEKIRTIGDNYMVAAGVPRRCPDHALRLASMALDMQEYIRERCGKLSVPIEFRIGINSGPVVGGVIGRKKFVYDVWGDAVNIASRMESQGVAGKIQVTEATYRLIRDHFVCEPRGVIQVKGRGEMETWFLVQPEGIKEHAISIENG